MFTSFCAASSLPLPGRSKQARQQTVSPIAGHGLSVGSCARRWALPLIPMLLLLASLQAQAADYIFPGFLPNACTVEPTNNAAGIFNCGPLTLAAGDTITVTRTAQINVNGDFVTGAYTRLNSSGSSANLTIVVSGISYLGDYTILHGNIIGINSTAGTITTGANTEVIGNLTTTTAGVINVGQNSSVTGDLNTKSGAINVGDNSTITGSILSSLAGAITVGVNVKVSGTVSSTGEKSGVGAGAITIGDNSIIHGGITTNTGAITVNVGSKVGGNIITNDGAITVATNVNVTGSVCTGNSGAITIGDSANIGGNVETANAGAITIGNSANVTGGVKVQKAGATTIAPDATVGSRIGSGCAIGPPQPKPVPRVIYRDWRQLFMR